jgi:hypothetical protein
VRPLSPSCPLLSCIITVPPLPRQDRGDGRESFQCRPVHLLNGLSPDRLGLSTHLPSPPSLSSQEYLPTHEEISVLKGYRGDYELLGPAEKYMMVMAECQDAHKRIKCILFRQQFRPRREELINAIRRLESVCDDVKMSMKLKKVLQTILKVGNQLNEGEDHMGFTVDSLLKLQSQKAFDKKTSILQYVVRLVSRNDEACLLFPEDLVHLTESERLSIDQVMAEMSQLSSSFTACRDIVHDIITASAADKSAKQKLKSMTDFLSQVPPLPRSSALLTPSVPRWSSSWRTSVSRSR